MTHAYRDQLLAAQQALEESLLRSVQEFEKMTGMVVKSVKIYPGHWHDGLPITRAIEVGAQLR